MAQIVCDWEAATGWNPSQAAPETIAGFILEALPDREIWVIGEPVEAYLSFDPSDSRVGGLYSGRPNGGLGKALMDKVKERRDFVCLRTHEPNEAAQRFYRREGFVEVSRHAPEPPNTVPEIRMEWRR